MKRSVWPWTSAALVSTLIAWPALASPSAVGTWDVVGKAVARYRYEGHRTRLEVPFTFAVTFAEDATYRATAIQISCLPDGVTLPEFSGTWRLAPNGTVRANPPLHSRSSCACATGRARSWRACGSGSPGASRARDAPSRPGARVGQWPRERPRDTSL
jgi:hypothetical protein